MSGIDVSMEPMLEMFLYETNTLIEQLDGIMLESEKSHRLSPESINEIFRIMHTIKGSAAMMGLDAIAGLAHKVEDLFFIVRENSENVTMHDEIFDVVFQSSDALRGAVENITADSVEPDFSQLIVKIVAIKDTLNGELTPEAAKATVATATTATVAQQPTAQTAVAAPIQTEVAQDELRLVRVYFEDNCQMENVRAFMLVTQLNDLCNSLETEPSEPEKDSSTAAEIIKNGFLLKFVPAVPLEEILGVVESAINIKSYEFEDPEEATASTEQVVAAVAPEEKATGVAPAAAAADAVPTDAASAAATLNKASGGKQSLISVNQSKLDQLMDLMGEIVITESMVSGSPDLKGLLLDNFSKATRQLRKLTDELQDIVMSMRMVPLSGTFQKMQRIVRDMSKKLGKNVELVTIGGETEVDKTIIDSITDPFMHMVRNSMDHGIETPAERKAAGKPEMAQVTMAAQNVAGEIVITIADDGKGLDAERIMYKARNNGLLTKAESEYTDKEIFSLIMLPGFSTNEQVTEFSGRGVGMDVVRKNIEKCGGSLSVESKKDAGTVFTIKIPLTLAIVDGMELAVGDTVFTLPITSIKQSFKVSEETPIVIDTDGKEMMMVRGDCYRVMRLHEIYGIPTQVTDLHEGIVILIESDQRTACLFADELLGEQQVVVKPFPIFLSRYDLKGKGMAGCTILGDGSISLILDANNLLEQ